MKGIPQQNMKKQNIIFFVLLFLALLTRLALLNFRPLHHDEGVNYFFASQILEFGKFSYDPLNYHGPLYFFSIFLSFIILGVSEFSLRLPAALFGILTTQLPYFFRFYKNSFSPHTAALFFTLSPSLLYYSRYSIHETALVFFTLLTLFIFTLILDKKEVHLLPYFALSLALLLTIKETAVITIFALMLIGLIQLDDIKKLKLWENSVYVSLSLLLFVFLYFALYSAFFTNLEGFVQSFRGFLPWMERGFQDTGHFKPWHYYLLLISQYELPLFLLALAGIWYSRKNLFLRNVAILFFSHLIIYSSIKYKMPWIVINITAPMAILAAAGLYSLPLRRSIKKAAFGASILYLGASAVFTNALYPWQKINKFAYVHTHKDTVRLVDMVQDIAPPDSDILIASNEYWPLPFYFHGNKTQYLSNIASLNVEDYPTFEIFIMQNEIFSSSKIPEGFMVKKFQLREGVILYLVYKP